MRILLGEDEEGNERWLPARYEVCDLCGGKGSHVNPSIDAHGLTAEDFHDDPEFAEAYGRGVYDVPCNNCDGMRVSLVVDRDACSAELLEEYDDEEEAEANYRAMAAAERQAEARMMGEW